MIIKVSKSEFDMLRAIIKKKTEISLGDNKKYLVETRLSSLVVQSGCKTFDEFCRKLNHIGSSGLMDQVIEAITTKETYWFRDEYPFNYIKEEFLPRMVRQIKSGERETIRIWSGASSYGQEAYSIAMTALEFKRSNLIGKPLSQCLSILGTDISGIVVEKARQGIYTDNDVRRGLPEEFLDLYFRKDQKNWKIDERVKRLVTFSVFNLQSPFPDTWKRFDLIMLRNAIIYFSDSFKKILLERTARLLAPGGILFLGTGESVSGYTDHFEIFDYQKAKYYRLIAS